MDSYDAAIVGAGAAGLNAALLLGRSCRTVALIDDGKPRNAVADRMHGFLTRDGTPPGELLSIARDELRRYSGVHFVNSYVDSIERAPGGFTVRCGESEMAARRVILAVGVRDDLPKIAGLDTIWGRLAFVCPYCDAWEVRGKRLAIAAPGCEAVELAQELWQWTDDLVVCLQSGTNVSDAHRAWMDAIGARVHESPIARVHELGGVQLSFENGEHERVDALFLCAPLRLRSPLADMLGCAIGKDGEIVVDDRNQTTVPGVYAAGDAVTIRHQVIIAAASGVRAAIAVNEDLLEEDVRRVTRQSTSVTRPSCRS